MLKSVLIPVLTLGWLMGFADQDIASKAKKINLAGGKKAYQTYCIACHGEKGKGDGPAGMALKPKPRNFTDTAFIKKEPKMKMYNVINEGGKKYGLSPMMSAWGKSLKPDQINDVLAYVLTFSESSSEAMTHVMSKENEVAEKETDKAPAKVASDDTAKVAQATKEKPKEKKKSKDKEEN